MQQSTTTTALRTAVEIALARATEIEKIVAKRERKAATAERQQVRRAEWRRRLDAAAYTCERDGALWIAEGPAGQRFSFRRAEDDPCAVVCASHTGGEYRLEQSADTGRWDCTCPTPEESFGPHGCKHATAFEAVRMAARMAKAQAEQKVAA